MSRIGRKPVAVPSNVKVEVSGQVVKVAGPVGELAFEAHPLMAVEFDGEAAEVRVSRPDDSRSSRALHGLTRSLIQNMVTGVVTPFEKALDIVGVGYNATLSGNSLTLQVGFANKIVLTVPNGVQCDVPQPTRIQIKGADKQVVGQFAAEIRRVRPPEPYKGKGIRYSDEVVKRKAGKAFGSK